MKENVIQTNSGITINVDMSVRKVIYVNKIMLGSYYVQLQNGKYLGSIMDKIICDKIIDFKKKRILMKKI